MLIDETAFRPPWRKWSGTIRRSRLCESLHINFSPFAIFGFNERFDSVGRLKSETSALVADDGRLCRSITHKSALKVWGRRLKWRTRLPSFPSCGWCSTTVSPWATAGGTQSGSTDRTFLRSSPVRNYWNFLNAGYFREDRSKSFRIQPTDLWFISISAYNARPLMSVLLLLTAPISGTFTAP